MSAALELVPAIGTQPACTAIGVPRASLYRSLRPKVERPRTPRPRPRRALSAEETALVLETLDSERFVHAPNSTGVVRVETLSSSYWGSRYVGARRIKASASSN